MTNASIFIFLCRFLLKQFLITHSSLNNSTFNYLPTESILSLYFVCTLSHPSPPLLLLPLADAKIQHCDLAIVP